MYLRLPPLSDVVIAEGDTLVRSGSFTDADLEDSWTATVDYGDGSGVQPLALVGTTFALNHVYADSGEYLTTVSVVDRNGATGSAAFRVTLQNLAPTVDAGADQAVNEGAPVTLTATFRDRGINDTHTAVIDWGDGTGSRGSQLSPKRWESAVCRPTTSTRTTVSICFGDRDGR